MIFKVASFNQRFKRARANTLIGQPIFKPFRITPFITERNISQSNGGMLSGLKLIGSWSEVIWHVCTYESAKWTEGEWADKWIKFASFTPFRSRWIVAGWRYVRYLVTISVKLRSKQELFGPRAVASDEIDWTWTKGQQIGAECT